MRERVTGPIHFDRVADIYDAYVTVDFDIPFWLHEAGAVRGKVLELACGTGRVSIPLLKAGVDLTCVDYAPRMLTQLRGKLEKNRLSCPLYCQDMSALALPARFDLIFIPFHSFSEILERQKQRDALLRIRAHLTSRGRFICTLQNPAVRTASMDGNVQRIGEFPMQNENVLRVASSLTFDPATHIASGIQLYEQLSPDGHLVEQRSLDIVFYLFTRDAFERAASEAGFEIETIYGDYDRHAFNQSSSPFMIWKLK